MIGFKNFDASSAFTWATYTHDIVNRYLHPGSDHLESAGSIIFGTSGNDQISGRDYTSTGSDIVFGGAGDDVIVGYGETGPSSASTTAYAQADKADYLDGGSGNDSINAGGGNDVVSGGAGNDRINGGPGDDLIYGGAGNDQIASGRGADLLWGGAGKDVFHFTMFGGPYELGEDTLYGVDTIFDFKPGTDKLEFQSFSPIAGSLQLIDNGRALEVHFDYQYISGVTHAEVDLVGVHSLGAGDIVFV